ncbi:MAG: helix-turn-helix transcriptional regulator [Bacteroidetes bacterium]|nr:helix-turn-helix transcriptional regulator [Bacteroidota bacterium]
MVDRIHKILRYYKLTSSGFADEIGVQRSSISHVLSGRNKPSLGFIQKILNTYSEINAEWLVMGIGKLAQEENNSKDIFTDEADNSIKSINHLETIGREGAKDERDIQKSQIIANRNISSPPGLGKGIKKIIILNDDNTFSEYYPEN